MKARRIWYSLNGEAIGLSEIVAHARAADKLNPPAKDDPPHPHITFPSEAADRLRKQYGAKVLAQAY